MLGSARAAIVAIGVRPDPGRAGRPARGPSSNTGEDFRTGRSTPSLSQHGWRCGEASAADLQPLADALVAARGLALKPSPVQRQDNALQGWSWIDGTFSWGEPTAWALLALKKCRARGMTAKGAEARIRDGEAILRDRVCVTGGWNYGNSNVFGQGPACVRSDNRDRSPGAAGLRGTSPSCDAASAFSRSRPETIRQPVRSR